MVGGMGKHVAELVPALGNAGVEVHVVTPDLRGGPAEQQVGPKVMVHRVPTPDMTSDYHGFVPFAQSSNSSLERKAKELVETLGRFDLVHAHDWLVGYSGVALKYAHRLPLVATIHATERGRGRGHMLNEQARAINGTEWWLTFEAWRVITVSHFMAAQLHDYFGLPPGKVSVIHNGVGVPTTPQLSEQQRKNFRRRFVPDDYQMVFYVGRVVYEKGIQVLIEAAPAVRASRPQTKFVIAGTGAYLEQLQQFAYERGVADMFTFSGFISDEERDSLFQSADVAVFPSLYEPFGIVALEAMSYHCPVVVSATGGLQEVVRLHETGMTAHVGNPELLAWAIIQTLTYPEWARKRAENAFLEVQKLYTWQHIAEQTIAVYKQVHDEWHASGWGHHQERS